MEGEPLSRQIVMTAKTIKALFEDALGQEDATLATWVVLNGVERGRWASQTGLAKELRIEGATVTRHLDRLRARGPRHPLPRSGPPADLGGAHRGRQGAAPSARSVARRLDDRVCAGLTDKDHSDLAARARADPNQRGR